jgi:coenzyme F420-dependent glucose-6-phosphate dehydrogenase
VVLGMGTGESLNEVPASGLEWPEQKERTARFREALRLIRTLWSYDRVSFEGQYYRTKLATIYDRPREPVPIYVAGAGPFIAKVAGMEGDGFICTSGKKWDSVQRDAAAERAGGSRRIGPRAQRRRSTG